MANKTFRSCGSSAALRDQFNAFVDDVDDIRTKFASLLAKLDADGGVTDTNYAATLALAAKTTGDLVEA
jgi:hypothetical protein